MAKQESVQESVRLRISGMTCDHCARKIEEGLRKERGVIKAAVDYNSNSGEVTVDPAALGPERVPELPIFKGQYGAMLVRSPEPRKQAAPPSARAVAGGD